MGSTNEKVSHHSSSKKKSSGKESVTVPFNLGLPIPSPNTRTTQASDLGRISFGSAPTIAAQNTQPTEQHLGIAKQVSSQITQPENFQQPAAATTDVHMEEGNAKFLGEYAQQSTVHSPQREISHRQYHSTHYGPMSQSTVGANLVPPKLQSKPLPKGYFERDVEKPFEAMGPPLKETGNFLPTRSTRELNTSSLYGASM